jgi:hypothetical protein
MKIWVSIILFLLILISASGAEIIKTKCFNIDRSNKLWHKPDSTTSARNDLHTNYHINIFSYPNPANDAIIFEIKGLDLTSVNCRIDDLSGKNVIDFGKIDLSNNKIEWNLFNSNSIKITSGIYFLNIHNTSFKHSYKFIVN